jgi:hypothetical protein
VILKQKKSKNKADIRYFDEYIVKQQKISDAKKEFLRTRLSYQSLMKNKNFIVPRPISLNEENGQIFFERLYNFKCLGKLNLNQDKQEFIIEKSAHILADIHCCIVTNESDISINDLVDGCNSVTNEGHLFHGDFCLQNILFNERSQEFAIIDWYDAFWLKNAEFADRQLVDIATFLIALFSQHYFSKNRYQNLPRLGQLFIDKYSASRKLNKEVLKTYITELMNLYWRFRQKRIGKLRTIFYYHTRLELLSFVRTL